MSEKDKQIEIYKKALKDIRAQALVAEPAWIRLRADMVLRKYK